MTETVSPRLFRIRPIDATLIPLPSELTTPPVTKINFVGICLRNTRMLTGKRGGNLPAFRKLGRLAEPPP